LNRLKLRGLGPVIARNHQKHKRRTSSNIPGIYIHTALDKQPQRFHSIKLPEKQ